MRFIGVEIEQETSAPSPKNPGSAPEPSLLARVILDLGWLHGEPLTANLTSGKFPATPSSRDTLLTYCYLGHYPWNAIYILYDTLC